LKLCELRLWYADPKRWHFFKNLLLLLIPFFHLVLGLLISTLYHLHFPKMKTPTENPNQSKAAIVDLAEEDEPEQQQIKEKGWTNAAKALFHSSPTSSPTATEAK